MSESPEPNEIRMTPTESTPARPPRTDPTPPLAVLERAVVPIAAYLALAAFTSTQVDTVGRAEGAFLALFTAGLLAVIAALAVGARHRGRSGELSWTALLAVAAVWIAYQGPSRGAVVSAVLLAGLTVSAVRSLLAEDGAWHRDGRLGLGAAAALALGLQLATRCDLLLAPLLAPRTLVSLLALPVAAGWAVSLLSARFGARRALFAGGSAALLAPGWTVTSTLALGALAAGVVIADRDRPKALRWGTAALVALLPWWSFAKGLLFAVAGLSMLGLSLTAAPLLLVAVALVAVKSPLAQVPLAAIREWVGAVVLVPAALVAPPDGRFRVRLGGLLALAAALVSGVPEAMAAGIALAALGMPTAGAVATLQGAWSAVAVIGVALLSAYPWVRQDPIGDLTGLLGASSEPVALLTVLAGVVGLGLLTDRLPPLVPRQWLHPLPLACLLALGPMAQSLGPSTLLVDSYGPVVLAGGSLPWRAELDGPVKTVVIDSHLTRGATLVPGRSVAAVQLVDGTGVVRAEWTLRAGLDTGEWAASRADLASRDDVVAPPPWISSVAPGGDFFAHRYRARFTVSAGLPGTRLVIERDPELPAEVVLSIYRVELRG